MIDGLRFYPSCNDSGVPWLGKVPGHWVLAHAKWLFRKKDRSLRDTEQVPLLEDGRIEAFLKREVLSHVADAWYDPTSVRTGCEVSFTRYFYEP
jgi:hypothetical protein